MQENSPVLRGAPSPAPPAACDVTARRRGVPAGDPSMRRLGHSGRRPDGHSDIRRESSGGGRRGDPRAAAVWCVVLFLCLVTFGWHALRRNRLSAHGGEGMTPAALGREVGRLLLSTGLPSPSFPWLPGEEGETTGPKTGESPSMGSSSTAGENEGDGAAGVVPESSSASTEMDATPTAPDVPTMPIVSVDMSQAADGSDRFDLDAGLDSILPASAWSWTTVGDQTATPPTVLIVHTHPWEAYGGRNGAAGWVPLDPSATEENVTALGRALADKLTARGVRVIHLTPEQAGVDPTMSYLESYRLTAEAVAALTARDRSIGLVIDLRRSAELITAPDGMAGVLRTAGTWQGQPCSQVRLIVQVGDGHGQVPAPGEAANGGYTEGGGTSTGTLGHVPVENTLAVALAWRARLYACSPTMSRPVLVRDGQGWSLASGVIAVTVEVGAAGNTYAEAAATITPLAVTLRDLLLPNV